MGDYSIESDSGLSVGYFTEPAHDDEQEECLLCGAVVDWLANDEMCDECADKGKQ